MSVKLLTVLISSLQFSSQKPGHRDERAHNASSHRFRVSPVPCACAALLLVFTQNLHAVEQSYDLIEIPQQAPLSGLHAFGDSEAGKLPAQLSSVLSVSARIPSHARSAAKMGTRRSGVAIVIDGDGLMVTAGMVVAEADRVTITGPDGNLYGAEVLAYDHATELALLRAPITGLVTPLPLGDSGTIKKGQKLLSLAAGGEEATESVTVGVVKPFAGGWGYVLADAIHTYPPTEVFSGNALVNEDGELLGIGTLISIDIDIDPKVRVPGNVFVPVNRLSAIIGELLVSGRSEDSERPWLGFEAKQTSDGIVVKAVVENGPAAQSGIAAGDTIVAVNQIAIDKMTELYEKVWDEYEPGDIVHLLILRDGRYANVPIDSVSPYQWYRFANSSTVITELDD